MEQSKLGASATSSCPNMAFFYNELENKNNMQLNAQNANQENNHKLLKCLDLFDIMSSKLCTILISYVPSLGNLSPYK